MSQLEVQSDLVNAEEPPIFPPTRGRLHKRDALLRGAKQIELNIRFIGELPG